jgi:hypothetical protein
MSRVECCRFSDVSADIIKDLFKNYPRISLDFQKDREVADGDVFWAFACWKMAVHAKSVRVVTLGR